MGGDWKAPPAAWTDAVKAKRDANVEKMAPRLQNNNVPMDYHGALGALKKVVADNPEMILVNEGANTLDFARSIIDMFKPRKRLDVGTWGVMGIGMGAAVAGVGAALEDARPELVLALGDRYEILAAVQAAVVARVPMPCTRIGSSMIAPTVIRGFSEASGS